MGRTRLEEIFSSAEILTSEAALAAHEADGMRPSVVVQPKEAAQVAEAVRFAASEKLALIPCGSGTKLGIGAPPERYDLALDLSRMDRVLACDPQDLTLGVEPGVRVADLLRTLREHKQFLPLAVAFGERATIGGAAASNSNSPLRHSYGGIRDFCLGMEFVTGEGAQCKSGGRVVKNVTGYELHKVLIGSLGTLAVITRVNLRMFPIPPAQSTCVATFAQAAAALDFCRAIAKSVLLPQMVEVVNPEAARILSCDGVRLDARQWSVVLSAAGLETVVQRHERDFAQLAAQAGAAGFAVLQSGSLTPVPPTSVAPTVAGRVDNGSNPSSDDESALLSRICEFSRLVQAAAPEAVIFRISALPTAMPLLLAQFGDVAARYDLAFAALARPSGFLQAAFLPRESGAALSAAATHVFHICAVDAIGARAMIEWCPTKLKREVDVWGPARADWELMQRVKQVFDGQRVFSPGRFAGGI